MKPPDKPKCELCGSDVKVVGKTTLHYEPKSKSEMRRIEIQNPAILDESSKNTRSNYREFWIEENAIATNIHAASTSPFKETSACKSIHVIECEYAKALEDEIVLLKNKNKNYKELLSADLDRIKALELQVEELKFKNLSDGYLYKLLDEVRIKLESRVRELELECKHPGCCCVCGHQGKCPEDGPSAVSNVTD